MYFIGNAEWIKLCYSLLLSTISSCLRLFIESLKKHFLWGTLQGLKCVKVTCSNCDANHYVFGASNFITPLFFLIGNSHTGTVFRVNRGYYSYWIGRNNCIFSLYLYIGSDCSISEWQAVASSGTGLVYSWYVDSKLMTMSTKSQVG